MKFALLAFLFATMNARAAERSVSPSRQFIVYSDDAQLRGAVSDLAEQLKRNTLSILRESDGWKTPIILNVQTRQANMPDAPRQSMHFSQTGAGLKLQLDLIAGELNADDLRREILRAVLLERMYRRHRDIAPGSALAPPPEWLLDGLLARFDGKVFPIATQNSLEEFLRRRPDELDVPARELYRGGALALLNVIVDLAPSRGGFGRYLDSLMEASNDSLGDLRAQFPELTAVDLEELWRARLNRGSARGAELLQFGECDEQIAQALRIELGGKSLSLADFVKPKLSPTEKAALELTAEKLMLMGGRAHPVLRPIASEYQQLAQLLRIGKSKGVTARLAKINETRQRLVRRMEEIDDYMNWFEATQMTTPSGVFDDYLRSGVRAKPQSARRDAISVYLDAVELQTQ